MIFTLKNIFFDFVVKTFNGVEVRVLNQERQIGHFWERRILNNIRQRQNIRPCFFNLTSGRIPFPNHRGIPFLNFRGSPSSWSFWDPFPYLLEAQFFEILCGRVNLVLLFLAILHSLPASFKEPLKEMTNKNDTIPPA